MHTVIMIMSSRTLSQRDNVKRTRRFSSQFEKWGLGEEPLLLGML